MNEEQVRKLVEEQVLRLVEERVSSLVSKTAQSVATGKFSISTKWNITAVTDGDTKADKYEGDVDVVVKWDSESK